MAQDRLDNSSSKSSYTSRFSNKIICACCGGHYHQRTRTKTSGEKEIFYACEYKIKTGNKCTNIYVHEDSLRYYLTLCIQRRITEFPDVLAIVRKAISKTIKDKARLKIITESLNEGWRTTISDNNIYLLFKSITVNPDSTLIIEMFDSITESCEIKRKQNTPKKPHIKFIGKIPEETVNQILVLRARGYVYKKIAEELNISKNTVASFFRRKKS